MKLKNPKSGKKNYNFSVEIFTSRYNKQFPVIIFKFFIKEN